LTGEKPVSAGLVKSVLSRQQDDLEPTLTRHGYRMKDLVNQLDANQSSFPLCSTRREPQSRALKYWQQDYRFTQIVAGNP
jgi:hypothetical protein